MVGPVDASNVVAKELERAVTTLSPGHSAAFRQRAKIAHDALTEHTCDQRCSADPLGSLLGQLLSAPRLSNPETWALLWCVGAARLPSNDELEQTLLAAERGRLDDAAAILVAATRATDGDDIAYTLTIVEPGTLVVDVTHTYIYAWLLTGIQRVVRGLVAGLRANAAADGFVLAVTVSPGRQLLLPSAEFDRRLLSAGETVVASERAGRVRLSNWAVEATIAGLLRLRDRFQRRIREEERFASSAPVATARRVLHALYRHRSRLAAVDLTRVIFAPRARQLVADLATEPARVETLLRWRCQLGGRLSVIFYDAIPLTHPHYCSEGTVVGYATYVRALGVTDVAVAISETARQSAAALLALTEGGQGTAVAVPLPVSRVDASVGTTPELGGAPLILCVASLEPRKNHVRLLRAAQELHDEGVDFELMLVGGSGWLSDRIEQAINSCRLAGVTVQTRRGVSDEQLSGFYARARAVAFVSEVEGYGLPIAEALAHGVPVVCSDVGSMAEIARDGGCLTVSPFDTAQITDALRRILVDDDLHRRLVNEASSRRDMGGSWERYAAAVLREI